MVEIKIKYCFFLLDYEASVNGARYEQVVEALRLNNCIHWAGGLA
jgi:hypothetical protein